VPRGVLRVNLVAYTRVSTTKQSSTGLGLDAQEHVVRSWADAMGHTITRVYRDEGSSGKSLDRDILKQALMGGCYGTADGLIVAKLDRLSRNVGDFAQLVGEFEENDKTLVCVRDGIDLATPVGRFTAHIMASVAQLERETLSERTRDAMQQLRDRGIRLGRKPSEDVGSIDANRIRRMRDAGETLRGISEATGFKVSTVRRVLASEPS